MSDRRLSRRGAKFIAKFEGFRSCPYQDSVGVWTIGYGHTSGVSSRTPCVSRARAIELLQQDAQIAANAVNRYVKVPLNQPQFDALVSFAFNAGVGALEESTLLKKLNRRRYSSVPNQLMRWVHAGHAVLAGLVRRRRAEGRLFRRPWKRRKR